MRLGTEMQVFPGWEGTWYLIDTEFIRGERWFLYESEIYGNDAAWLVVNGRTGKVLCETYDPLEFAVNEALDLEEEANGEEEKTRMG